MLRNIAQTIIDYYQFIILPMLSISIFYAMEYMSNGVDFFINEKGVKWRFLTFCAFMQLFVSLVVIISVIAIFKSDTLKEYETFKMVTIILLGTTPFNISILIWVAIKLEIYRLMKNRYKDELKDLLNTKSLISESLRNTYELDKKEISKENIIKEDNIKDKEQDKDIAAAKEQISKITQATQRYIKKVVKVKGNNMNKFCIATAILVLFLFYNIQQRLEQVSLSLDSNSASLLALSEKMKMQQADAKIEKLKDNIKAFNNTTCQTCHVANTRLLLPIDDKKLNFASFVYAVRHGNLYMLPFSENEISQEKLQSIYEIIYKEKANGGGKTLN